MTEPTDLLEVINRTKGKKKTMAKKKVKKSRRGRPKGSKNKPKLTTIINNAVKTVGKRGRPPKSIASGKNWLDNINMLGKQLEAELLAAIMRIRGV